MEDNSDGTSFNFLKDVSFFFTKRLFWSFCEIFNVNVPSQSRFFCKLSTFSIISLFISGAPSGEQNKWEYYIESRRLQKTKVKSGSRDNFPPQESLVWTRVTHPAAACLNAKSRARCRDWLCTRRVSSLGTQTNYLLLSQPVSLI